MGRVLFQFFRGGFEVPMRCPSGDAELEDGDTGLELRKVFKTRGRDFRIISL